MQPISFMIKFITYIHDPKVDTTGRILNFIHYTVRWSEYFIMLSEIIAHKRQYNTKNNADTTIKIKKKRKNHKM